MASPLRFLPFVSENTHISAIYKKLIEGSKGIAEDTILSMAGIIYKKGIETVREDLAKFANLESWAARYESLLCNNENLRVPAGTAAFLKLVSVHLSDEELKLLKELKIPDLGLAYVISVHGTPEDQKGLNSLCNLAYAFDIDTRIANFHSFEAIGLFKEGCRPLLVGSKQELKAYVFYKMYIRPSTEERHPVTLIYVKRP